MDDLRTKKEIENDSRLNVNKQNKKDFLILIKIIFLWLYSKKILKYGLIIIIISLVLIYPVEIGTFIGEWIYNFKTSLITNLKNG